MFRLILAILKGKNLYILEGTKSFTSLGIVILHYEKNTYRSNSIFIRVNIL